MARQRKKRTKAYSGSAASLARPVVTKITAADRSRPAQWWFEKKRLAKPALIAALVVAVVIWLVFELIRTLS